MELLFLLQDSITGFISDENTIGFIADVKVEKISICWIPPTALNDFGDSLGSQRFAA
jgi:hypothetical protein